MSCALLTTVLLSGCASGLPAYRSTPGAEEFESSGEDDLWPGDEEMEESDDELYVAICVSKRTRSRVAYRPCDDAQPGFTWYFIPEEGKIPATDQKAKGGSFTDPGYEGFRARARGGPVSEAIVSDEENRVSVCVRKRTRVRVADDRCDDEDDGFAWYNIPLDGYAPAVGRKAEGGSFYFTGWDGLRARKKGGKARDAVIERVQQPQSRPTRGPRCTMTINGRCANAGSGCTYTVNGACRDNGGFPGLPPGRADVHGRAS
ncbi:hypothetical protein [Streptosporangium carneum]|uniref:Uncharacterized protein n=1 Tax=Streptosporangium carneum TaxID=47481 RepID=A0A9W6HW35_9ACTN|nr:hypothetical protein [Streptosporangium carneum]GLK07132.1 hypothetical protein GCM10017600_05370 [Streptosporangium carneum]